MMMTTLTGNARVKFVLGLFALVGLAALSIPFWLDPPGKVYVELADDVFQSDLSGKIATVNINSPTYRANSKIVKTNDQFFAFFDKLPSGLHDLALAVEGYKTEEPSYSIAIPAMETARFKVKLTPNFGRVKVMALDARRKGVHLKQFTVRQPELQLAVDGNQNGAMLDLDPGAHTIDLEAPDYCPAKAKVVASSGQISEKKVPLSPKIAANEIARVILNWGPSPKDLDSHLLLPKSPLLKTKKARHIFYPSNQMKAMLKNGAKAGELDIDYTNSEGFETITIYKELKGTYQYAVFQYSDDGSIDTSEATVELKTNGCEGKHYQAPSNCRQKWWHVFNLEFDGATVKIVEKNRCVSRMGWRIGNK